MHIILPKKAIFVLYISKFLNFPLHFFSLYLMNIYKKLIEDKPDDDHGIRCVKTLISELKLINIFRNKECLPAKLQLIDKILYKRNFHKKIC